MYKNLIIIFCLLPFLAVSQNTPLNAFFDDALDQPGFSSSEIHTQEVSFDWEGDDEMEQLREVLDGIESVRILSYNDLDENARKEMGQVYRKIEKALGKDDYVEAMAFSSDNDLVNIYFLKQGEQVKEFALITRGEHKVTLITVTGDIDLAKVMQKETMQGLWSLKGACPEGHHSHTKPDKEEAR